MARSLSPHRRLVGRAVSGVGQAQPSTSTRGRGAEGHRQRRHRRTLTWAVTVVVLAVAFLDLPFLPSVAGLGTPAADAAVPAPPTAVDRPAGGQIANNGAFDGLTISDDGRFVAFTSSATNL